jgi:Protein of unknown function (DUF1279)
MRSLVCSALVLFVGYCSGFLLQTPAAARHLSSLGGQIAGVCPASTAHPSCRSNRLVLAVQLKDKEAEAELEAKEKEGELAPDEATRKFGLEAGLFQVFKSGGKDKGAQAKDLLKRYGSAYLITSISFALVSFAICYALVDSGVDIAGLLNKVGIDATATQQKAGTFAVAYAAHKAASPIRFPPTVALTPVVAKFLGKEVSSESSDAVEEENR